jgi:hypothetical protein
VVQVAVAQTVSYQVQVEQEQQTKVLLAVVELLVARFVAVAVVAQAQ